MYIIYIIIYIYITYYIIYICIIMYTHIRFCTCAIGGKTIRYMWFPKWLAGVDEADPALGGGPVSNRIPGFERC
jgi:hypothetical protein